MALARKRTCRQSRQTQRLLRLRLRIFLTYLSFAFSMSFLLFDAHSNDFKNSIATETTFR